MTPPINPPIGIGISTNHKSSNRVELSELSQDIEENDNSTVTYIAIIDGSRYSHFFVLHKDCEIFETEEGILFKTKKNLKDEDKSSSVCI